MPLAPIDLRPGVYKNGTAYSGKSRWADSNLVRWKDGAIRVIGGWQRRENTSGVNIAALYADPTTEAARNVITWKDNTSVRHIVIGTNSNLYHVSVAGVVTDVTPAGFVGGDKDSGFEDGFGIAAYGSQSYGTRRTAEGLAPTPVSSWGFTLWGEDLLAQFRGDGPVYIWQPNDVAATALTDPPQNFEDILVTDERILMGVGSVDPRTISWSDSEDRTDWTPAADNQAGSIRLTGSGKLTVLTQVLNQVLVLGENEAHVGRYIGPPYIYGFDRVGDICGVMSAQCLVTTDKFAMWLCGRSVWMFDGTIRKIDSAITDFLYTDLRFAEKSKTYGFSLRDWDEIWWVYQSNDSTTTEPDSYICFDYAQNHWTKGKINRTLGADRGATVSPIMISPDGYIYNHELATTSIQDGPIPYVETGPIEIGAGDTQTYIDYIYPDELAQGDVTLTIKTRDMPNSASMSSGPYSMANPVPVRARGRQLALYFEGRAAGWMIGIMRANIKPGGRR
jgi:hypothetical protein